MTEKQPFSLENELERIYAEIDEYSDALLDITQRNHAVDVLIYALTAAAKQAGAIIYRLKEHKE